MKRLRLLTVWIRLKRFLFSKLIPHGEYCYEVKQIDIKNGRVKTRICPFFEFPSHELEICARCNLIGSEDFLLEDQVKCCGINID